jgi:putative SOS response-associated peptidase YedK
LPLGFWRSQHALFRVVNRYVGNLPPMPGVFPDYPAPVVRNTGAERELTMMRWGISAMDLTCVRLICPIPFARHPRAALAA